MTQETLFADLAEDPTAVNRQPIVTIDQPVIRHTRPQNSSLLFASRRAMTELFRFRIHRAAPCAQAYQAVLATTVLDGVLREKFLIEKTD